MAQTVPHLASTNKLLETTSPRSCCTSNYTVPPPTVQKPTTPESRHWPSILQRRNGREREKEFAHFLSLWQCRMVMDDDGVLVSLFSCFSHFVFPFSDIGEPNTSIDN